MGTSTSTGHHRARRAGLGALALGTAVATIAEHRAVTEHRNAGSDRLYTELLAPRPGTTVNRVPVSDGGEIRVVERGSGTPLLLVHGITLAAEIWAYQLDDLSDRYRVLALDLRGHGESRAGTGGYGISRLARDLAEVMEGLDLTGAVIAGHSMGGMATIEMLTSGHAALERLAGVALVATTAGLVYEPHVLAPLNRTVTRRAVSPILRRAADRGWRVAPRTDISYWASRTALGENPDPMHVLATEHFVVDMAPDSLAGCLEGVAGFDVWERLRSIDLPALVVVGTHDRLTPPWHARRLVSELANAELAVLPGSGHMVMLERRNELAVLLDAFAKDVVARSTASRSAPAGSDAAASAPAGSDAAGSAPAGSAPAGSDAAGSAPERSRS